MTDEPTLDEAASAIHDGEERPADVEPSQALSDRLADWGEVSDAVGASPAPPPDALRELHIGNALAAFDEDRAFVDPIPASPGDPSLAAVGATSTATPQAMADGATEDAAEAADTDPPLPPKVTAIGDAPSRRRGVWLASAAAAVVLVLVGVGLLASQDDNDADVAGAPEAAGTAEQVLDERGRNAGDGDAQFGNDGAATEAMVEDGEMTDGEMADGESMDAEMSDAGVSAGGESTGDTVVVSSTAAAVDPTAAAETQVPLEPLELPVEPGGKNLLEISPLPPLDDPPCVDRLLDQLRGPGQATFTRAVDLGDNRIGYLFGADGTAVAAGFVDATCVLVSQDVDEGWFFG